MPPIIAQRRRGSCQRLPIILVSCLLLFNSGITHAKPKDKLKVLSTTTYIEMHTGPGRGYPIFHVIEKGETITLLKSKTSWIKVVTAKGIEGWVNRRFMDETIGPNGELVDLGLPNREDFVNRRWEVGASIGEFETIPSIGFYGAYRLTKNISAELRFNQATGSFSNSRLWSWGLVNQPFPEWRISPFFTIANGEVDISPNSSFSQAQDVKDSFFLVGTGAYFYAFNRFVLRFEYNNYITLPNRDENENVDEWKIGLTSFF